MRNRLRAEEELERLRKAFDLSDDEKIDVVAKRILEKHRGAFEELAK